MTWKGDRIIQRHGHYADELGYVEKTRDAEAYKLWLKDSTGVTNSVGSYVLGGDYGSKDQAMRAPATTIIHMIWMRSLVVKVVEDNWDDIAPELGRDVSKADVLRSVRDWVYSQSKEVTTKIVTNVVVKKIVDLILSIISGTQ